MEELTFYFNEHCLPLSTTDLAKLEKSLDSFIAVTEAIFMLRPDAKIGFFSANWNEDCAGEPLAVRIKKQFRSEKTRYLRLLSKIRLLQISDVEQKHEVKYKGTTAAGFTLADLSGQKRGFGWSFSFPCETKKEWSTCQISADRYVLTDDGNVDGPIECVINHISSVDHLNNWTETIRDWGRVVAPSSVVGMIGSHPIVMYPGPKEHNPPHVHLRISANHDGDIAKYRIEDFVREKGEGMWDKEMESWLKANREQLLISWERCQRGGHPYRLAEVAE